MLRGALLLKGYTPLNGGLFDLRRAATFPSTRELQPPKVSRQTPERSTQDFASRSAGSGGTILLYTASVRQNVYSLSRPHFRTPGAYTPPGASN